MYTFLLDRRSLTVLAICALIVGGSLFAAGLMTGRRQATRGATVPPTQFEPLRRFPGQLVPTSSTIPGVSDPGTAGEPPAPDAQPGDTGQPAVDPAADPTAPPAGATDRPGAGVAVARAPRSAPVAGFTFRTASYADAQPSTAVATSSIGPPYSVQVGAFGVSANAEKQLASALAAGLDAYVAPLETHTGEVLLAVRFGRYPSRAVAEARARDYEASGPDGIALVWPQDQPID